MKRKLAKEYLRRFAVMCLGLVVYGLGNAFGVLAGSAGTNAWGTLNIGVSKLLGFSYGTASLVIGLAIIVIDLIGRGKIGFGSILNIFIISVISDTWIRLIRFLPPPGNMLAGVGYSLIAQVIIAFATVLYMSPALGAGPRDTLMILVGKKLPNIPIGVVKFGIEVFALAAGVLLGAPLRARHGTLHGASGKLLPVRMQDLPLRAPQGET
ncbi:MAG: hypothetical protein IKF55_01915 [Oscillospiraceae bacterium]|nr:hypothetical protein [Oscillospiraceae bacterium]MBR3174606.1 hypothetical protein [Oscillospiraceae bacterium]